MIKLERNVILSEKERLISIIRKYSNSFLVDNHLSVLISDQNLIEFPYEILEENFKEGTSIRFQNTKIKKLNNLKLNAHYYFTNGKIEIVENIDQNEYFLSLKKNRIKIIKNINHSNTLVLSFNPIELITNIVSSKKIKPRLFCNQNLKIDPSQKELIEILKFNKINFQIIQKKYKELY